MPGSNFPSKIYSLLAKQIISDYGITEGRCLDIDTGDGRLGLELAKQSRLHVYLLDADTEGVQTAVSNCQDYGLSSRCSIIRSSAVDLPFIKNHFDLVVNHGSFFFWKNKPRALSEIYRILKVGGIAYIGGGASRLMSPKEIEEYTGWFQSGHKEDLLDWEKVTSPETIKTILFQTGIKSFSLSQNAGTWIEIRK